MMGVYILDMCLLYYTPVCICAGLMIALVYIISAPYFAILYFAHIIYYIYTYTL